MSDQERTPCADRAKIDLGPRTEAELLCGEQAGHEPPHRTAEVHETKDKHPRLVRMSFTW